MRFKLWLIPVLFAGLFGIAACAPTGCQPGNTLGCSPATAEPTQTIPPAPSAAVPGPAIDAAPVGSTAMEFHFQALDPSMSAYIQRIQSIVITSYGAGAQTAVNDLTHETQTGALTLPEGGEVIYTPFAQKLSLDPTVAVVQAVVTAVVPSGAWLECAPFANGVIQGTWKAAHADLPGVVSQPLSTTCTYANPKA